MEARGTERAAPAGVLNVTPSRCRAASPGWTRPCILLGDLRAPSDQGEIVMRHALITTHLLNQARDAAIAQAEADQRLEHQAGALPRAQPAGPGRFARVAALARRARALAARTT
jgi:hypothetical protein